MIRHPAAKGKGRWAIPVFWFAVLAVLVLSLMPAAPQLPSSGWDKTDHLLAYAALAFLGCRAYEGRMAVVLAGLLAYGGLIEVLQSLTPYRLAEWGDLLADGMGLAAGAVVFRLVSCVSARRLGQKRRFVATRPGQ